MIRVRLKRLGVVTLGFLILLLALSPAGPVLAQTYTNTFYGTVRIDGVYAEPGTVISALTQGGGGSGMCTVTTAGQYVLTVGSDNPNVEGKTVRFYVDSGDPISKEADQTFPFHDGWVIYLELTVTVTHDLTVTVDPTVGGTAEDLTNEAPYRAGTEIDIEAQAYEGYRFVDWRATADDSGQPAGEFGDANAAVTTFTMPAGDVTVIANFEAVYDLHVIAEPDEGGTATDLTGGSPYAKDTVVTIGAEPAVGYGFVGWTAPGTQGGEFGDPNVAETTFTMPDGDATVTAHFELLPRFDLHMAVAPPGSGTAFDMTGGSPYVEDSPVNIEAEAYQGHRFVSWTSSPEGDFANANAAQTVFTMPEGDVLGGVTVTANFEEVLTQMSFYGTVKLDGVNAPVGTEITAEVEGGSGLWEVITPGYYVLTVQGNAIEKGATIQFYIDGEEADQTFPYHDGWVVYLDLTIITPTYELTMTADPEEGGMAIDLTGGSPYMEGSPVNIKAEPATCYQFCNWTATAPGVVFDDPDAEETSFIMPAEASTVTANFELAATVTTQAATEVRFIVATLNMHYDAGRFSEVEVSFAYKKSAGSAWENTTWVPESGNGTYSRTLFALASGTQYDFQAQLRYNDPIQGVLPFEGDILHFTTSVIGGGCFIATAAYGTPMASQVQTLRDFRDEYLLTNPLGRALVNLYYETSPPIANFITDHPSLKPVVRAWLVPIVAMSDIAINTAATEKIAISAFLVLISVAMALWVTKRQGSGPQHT
jgi:uncharacterized repeat protein (TIGR02543 family)